MQKSFAELDSKKIKFIDEIHKQKAMIDIGSVS